VYWLPRHTYLTPLGSQAAAGQAAPYPIAVKGWPR